MLEHMMVLRSFVPLDIAPKEEGVKGPVKFYGNMGPGNEQWQEAGGEI